MENKNVPKKAAQNENTTAAVAPAAVKTVPKAEYEQMIAANMSLKAMADKTGLKAYHVRKQLEAYGLKTTSMAGPRMKMTDAILVKEAFEEMNGSADEEQIVGYTGLDIGIVKKVIKMFKREGMIVEAYVLLKKDAQTAE